MTGGGHTTVSTVSPYYKWILIAVIASFFISLVLDVTLALTIPTPTHTQGQVFGVVDFVVKATLGAILGLLGGKAP